MAANQNPIYTLTPEIGFTPVVLTTAANDYTGLSLNNYMVFQADFTNGSYVQKLRFKALGTNTATVARIYLNNGKHARANVCGPVTGLTGTPQTTGGTLKTGTFVGKVFTVDQWGSISGNSSEVTVNTTGPTARIDWFWTANTGANSYIISVGARTSEQVMNFTNANASYQQTGVLEAQGGFLNGRPDTFNTLFYGEVSLPATTAIATAATIDVDYPLNFALPPGWRIFVGLATTVAAGWAVSAIGGDY